MYPSIFHAWWTRTGPSKSHADSIPDHRTALRAQSRSQNISALSTCLLRSATRSIAFSSSGASSQYHLESLDQETWLSCRPTASFTPKPHRYSSLAIISSSKEHASSTNGCGTCEPRGATNSAISLSKYSLLGASMTIVFTTPCLSVRMSISYSAQVSVVWPWYHGRVTEIYATCMAFQQSRLRCQTPRISAKAIRNTPRLNGSWRGRRR